MLSKGRAMSCFRTICGGLLAAVSLCIPTSGSAEDRAAAPQTGLHLLILGDSLTDGYTLGKQKSYPHYLSERAKQEGIPLRITNAGVSGNTSADGLRRVSRVLKEPVDVFMLALGTNDLFRDVPLEQMDRNLRTILDRVREHSPKVILIVAGLESAWEAPTELKEPFEAAFRHIAEDYQAHYIPSLLFGVAGVPSLNLPDQIHPNTDGNKRIAEHVWPTVKKACALVPQADT